MALSVEALQAKRATPLRMKMITIMDVASSKSSPIHLMTFKQFCAPWFFGIQYARGYSIIIYFIDMISALDLIAGFPYEGGTLLAYGLWSRLQSQLLLKFVLRFCSRQCFSVHLPWSSHPVTVAVWPMFNFQFQVQKWGFFFSFL